MLADIGSYQLERVLGEGGMGVVYLAEHRVLRRRVAIKVLAPSPSMEGPAALQRFLDEAQATGAIEDPGIVQIFDFGYAPDGRAYLVMEYLEGERLDQRVARTGPLPVVQALRITRQLASSLRAAHARDILHRDLKPENILLVTDPAVPGGERTKLLDFGICKLMHRDLSVTCAGTIVGTPTYMSPEQCRGYRDLDPRSDVYSLGCVLYFLLTGRPPFPYRSTGELLAAHLKEKAPLASKINAAVPDEVDRLIRQCLAKLAADRVQSMAALIEELDEILANTTGELPAEVATTSYVRAAPANTTLTFAQVYAGTGPQPKGGARWSWGRRAVLLAAAAMALSAPAASHMALPSDVIPATPRAPVAERLVAGEALTIAETPTPRPAMTLPSRRAEPEEQPEEAWVPPPNVPIDGGLPIDAPPVVDAVGDAAVLHEP